MVTLWHRVQGRQGARTKGSRRGTYTLNTLQFRTFEELCFVVERSSRSNPDHEQPLFSGR